MFLAISLDTSKNLIFFLLSSFMALIIVTGLFLVTMINIDKKKINAKLYHETRLKINVLLILGGLSVISSVVMYFVNLNNLEQDDKTISLCVLIVGLIIILLTLFMCVSFISHTYNYSLERAERVFNKLHRGFTLDETLEKLDRFDVDQNNNILRIKYYYLELFGKEINTAKIIFSYNKLESIEMDHYSIVKVKENKKHDDK